MDINIWYYFGNNNYFLLVQVRESPLSRAKVTSVSFLNPIYQSVLKLDKIIQKQIINKLILLFLKNK